MTIFTQPEEYFIRGVVEELVFKYSNCVGQISVINILGVGQFMSHGQ